MNIESQLKNEYNMSKRSLYYWSKMYEEQLGEGEDYSDLRRTICINILNFKYLRKPESEQVRRLEMSIEEIRHAKDELIRLSEDIIQTL